MPNEKDEGKMKKCKVCHQPNPTPNSTCSIACKIALMKAKDEQKRKDNATALKNGEKPAKRQKTLKKKLKEEAWSLFSRFIRLKYADKNGNCTCVTCGTVKPWKEMQAGHAVGGRGGYVLFNEKIVRPQDYACNCAQKGKYPEFIDYLVNKEKSLTMDEYFDILRESHKPHKLKESDYIELISVYTEKLKLFS